MGCAVSSSAESSRVPRMESAASYVDEPTPERVIRPSVAPKGGPRSSLSPQVNADRNATSQDSPTAPPKIPTTTSRRSRARLQPDPSSGTSDNVAIVVTSPSDVHTQTAAVPHSTAIVSPLQSTEKGNGRASRDVENCVIDNDEPFLKIGNVVGGAFWNGDGTPNHLQDRRNTLLGRKPLTPKFNAASAPQSTLSAKPNEQLLARPTPTRTTPVGPTEVHSHETGNPFGIGTDNSDNAFDGSPESIGYHMLKSEWRTKELRRHSSSDSDPEARKRHKEKLREKARARKERQMEQQKKREREKRRKRSTLRRTDHGGMLSLHAMSRGGEPQLTLLPMLQETATRPALSVSPATRSTATMKPISSGVRRPSSASKAAGRPSTATPAAVTKSSPTPNPSDEPNGASNSSGPSSNTNRPDTGDDEMVLSPIVVSKRSRSTRKSKTPLSDKQSDTATENKDTVTKNPVPSAFDEAFGVVVSLDQSEIASDSEYGSYDYASDSQSEDAIESEYSSDTPSSHPPVMGDSTTRKPQQSANDQESVMEPPPVENTFADTPEKDALSAERAVRANILRSINLNMSSRGGANGFLPKNVSRDVTNDSSISGSYIPPAQHSVTKEALNKMSEGLNGSISMEFSPRMRMADTSGAHRGVSSDQASLSSRSQRRDRRVMPMSLRTSIAASQEDVNNINYDSIVCWEEEQFNSGLISPRQQGGQQIPSSLDNGGVPKMTGSVERAAAASRGQAQSRGAISLAEYSFNIYGDYGSYVEHTPSAEESPMSGTARSTNAGASVASPTTTKSNPPSPAAAAAVAAKKTAAEAVLAQSGADYDSSFGHIVLSDADLESVDTNNPYGDTTPENNNKEKTDFNDTVAIPTLVLDDVPMFESPQNDSFSSSATSTKPNDLGASGNEPEKRKERTTAMPSPARVSVTLAPQKKTVLEPAPESANPQPARQPQPPAPRQQQVPPPPTQQQQQTRDTTPQKPTATQKAEESAKNQPPHDTKSNRSPKKPFSLEDPSVISSSSKPTNTASHSSSLNNQTPLSPKDDLKRGNRHASPQETLKVPSQTRQRDLSPAQATLSLSSSSRPLAKDRSPAAPPLLDTSSTNSHSRSPRQTANREGCHSAGKQSNSHRKSSKDTSGTANASNAENGFSAANGVNSNVRMLGQARKLNDECVNISLGIPEKRSDRITDKLHLNRGGDTHPRANQRDFIENVQDIFAAVNPEKRAREERQRREKLKELMSSTTNAADESAKEVSGFGTGQFEIGPKAMYTNNKKNGNGGRGGGAGNSTANAVREASGFGTGQFDINPERLMARRRDAANRRNDSTTSPNYASSSSTKDPSGYGTGQFEIKAFQKGADVLLATPKPPVDPFAPVAGGESGSRTSGSGLRGSTSKGLSGTVRNGSWGGGLSGGNPEKMKLLSQSHQRSGGFEKGDVSTAGAHVPAPPKRIQLAKSQDEGRVLNAANSGVTRGERNTRRSSTMIDSNGDDEGGIGRNVRRRSSHDSSSGGDGGEANLLPNLARGSHSKRSSVTVKSRDNTAVEERERRRKQRQSNAIDY